MIKKLKIHYSLFFIPFVLEMLLACDVFFAKGSETQSPYPLNGAEKKAKKELKAQSDDIPIFYAGKWYYGKQKGGTGKCIRYPTLPPLYQIPPALGNTEIKSPATQSFKADGFFSITGSVNNAPAHDYLLLTVEKSDDSKQQRKARYFLHKEFNDRIWLPFGMGSYIVNIFELGHISINGSMYQGDNNGSINGWGGFYETPTYQFIVENTRNEEGCFLYPSYYIQSGDETIYRKALELTKGKNTSREKIASIHDWVCETLEYDNKSLVPNMYKKQDAVTVFNTKTAVCEGYVSITAAMLRSIGIRTKAMAGLGCNTNRCENHAWTNVDVDGSYYFMDPTWDDPTVKDQYGNTVSNNAEKYRRKYFLLPHTPLSHHPGELTSYNPDDYSTQHGGERPGRSITNPADDTAAAPKKLSVTMPMAIDFGY